MVPPCTVPPVAVLRSWDGDQVGIKRTSISAYTLYLQVPRPVNTPVGRDTTAILVRQAATVTGKDTDVYTPRSSKVLGGKH